MARHGYYPIELFSSTPFVYYQSLLDSEPHTYPPNSNNPIWTQSEKGHAMMNATGRKAYGFLKHEGFFQKEITSTDRITQALAFLQKAANIERANEVAFLKSRLKELDIDPNLFNAEDEEFDYVRFIEYLNGSAKGFKEYREVLLEEKKRIAAYREGLKTYEAKCAAYIREHNKTRRDLTAQERGYLMQESGLTAAVTYTTAGRRNEGAHRGETSTRVALALRGLFNNNSYISSIVSFVIDKYGSQLFNFSNGQLKLDANRSAVLVKHLTNWIYEHGAIELINNALFDDSTTITLSDDKQFVLPKSMQEELDDMVNNMLANPYLGETLDSIAQQYNLSAQIKAKKNTIIQRTRRFKDKLRNAYEREKANGNLPRTKKGDDIKFATWLKQQGLTNKKIGEIVTAADAISLQIHYESEGDAAMTIAENWNMPASVVGFKNLSTDVLGTAGHLIINISTNTEKIDQLQTQITKKIHQSQMDMAKKLKQNNSTDDFLKNSEIVRAAQIEQEKLIEEELKQIAELEKGSEKLLVALRQHTSIKDYATIGSKSKEYSGTSLGATLSAQIDRIESLMGAAGLEPIDGIWLRTFLINLAPGLIADFSEQRTQLEHYFATIFMFLMFDDNLVWVENIQKGTAISGGISNLHLYRLNSVFVPQSYILTKLHEALTSIYTQVKAAETNPTQYVHVKIHNNYKTQDSFFTGMIDPLEWYAESVKAESATKITLSFMGNFINLINQLEKTIQL